MVRTLTQCHRLHHAFFIVLFASKCTFFSSISFIFSFFFKNIRFLFGCNWQNIYICTALKKINTAFHFLFDSSAFCTVELTLCNVDNITVVYSRLPCLYCSIVCLRQTGLYFTLLSYPISFLSYVPLPHNNLRTHLINLSYMNKFTYLLLLLFCMMGGGNECSEW